MIGKVLAVCISSKKGEQKENIGEAQLIENHGIKGDAHAGDWHRQVSLLSYEKIENFKAKGIHVDDGDFGENLIVQGIDLATLPVGTILKIGQVELEVTQIGKECHDRCNIYYTVGDCIMPREGIFTKVNKGGTVKVGDEIKVVKMQ